MVEQEEVLMVTVMEGHVDPIVNLKVHVLAKASPMQCMALGAKVLSFLL